ncbi:MAG: hypothetical protein ACXAC5_22290 [Promethearchaeota archaeon]|jgi:hypothetical protein
MKTGVMSYMIYIALTVSEVNEKLLEEKISFLWVIPILIIIVVFVIVVIDMKYKKLKAISGSFEIFKIIKGKISAIFGPSQGPKKDEVQEIEPSKKKNAVFCNLCKIGELHKLPLIIRPVIASLRLTEIQLFESLSGASNLIANNQHEAWNRSENTLGPFFNKKAILHMTSLINPRTWGIREVWKKHHENIREIAMHEGSMARRLHVMWVDDLENDVSVRMIFSLMLAEYICNIRARLLCIERDSVKALGIDSDATGELYRWHDFCLFDYATLTTKYKMYGIIFTDITPYFIKENCLDFKLFGINTNNCELYYALRKNFYVGWNYSSPGAMFTLFELFNFIQTKGFNNIVNLSELHRFVPKGAKEKIPNTTKPIENLLNNCIRHSEEHHYSFYETEDFFQQELNELLERNEL